MKSPFRSVHGWDAFRQCVHLSTTRGYQLILLVVSILLLSREGFATAVQGTVIGVFSDPILVGQVKNDPAAGDLMFSDNSKTASYSINKYGGSSISWGTLGGISGPTESSSLLFVGKTIPANNSQAFPVGSITFLNGTSDPGTTIFGVSLNFYDNVVSKATLLGTDTIIITTTTNLLESASQDADYFNLCGNSSSICNQSIEAIEATNGGVGVTVDFSGVILGDPMLDITAVALAPGQSPITNGFLAHDPPVGVIPENSSVFLSIIGMLIVALLGKSRGRLTLDR